MLQAVKQMKVQGSVWLSVLKLHLVLRRAYRFLVAAVCQVCPVRFGRIRLLQCSAFGYDRPGRSACK